MHFNYVIKSYRELKKYKRVYVVEAISHVMWTIYCSSDIWKEETSIFYIVPTYIDNA